jgi:hypothetical protein
VRQDNRNEKRAQFLDRFLQGDIVPIHFNPLSHESIRNIPCSDGTKQMSFLIGFNGNRQGERGDSLRHLTHLQLLFFDLGRDDPFCMLKRLNVSGCR